jgi:predicted deacylase
MPKPGEKLIHNLSVATMARGDVLKIPVHSVTGVKEGPVVGFSCTSHGDEAFGILVVKELVERLDPSRMSGSFLGMPVMNPVAFEHYKRLTGVSTMTDEVNLNMAFPGSPKGSLVSQMAHRISTEFVENLDCLIDMHCGGIDTCIEYTLVKYDDDEVGKKSLDLARLYGLKVLSVSPARGYAGASVTELALRKNIPIVIPMAGGADASMDPATLERTTEGVLNILKHYGIVDGEIRRNPGQLVIGDRTLIRHNSGGLFVPCLGRSALNTIVEKGTLLGRTISPYTMETMEEFRAPFDRTILIMFKTCHTRVYPGDYAFIFGDLGTREAN